MDPISHDELAHRFQFHPADSDNKKEAHEAVREVCLRAADEIALLVPEGRELSTSITKLEEAMFWANAGLARGDGPKT